MSPSWKKEDAEAIRQATATVNLDLIRNNAAIDVANAAIAWFDSEGGQKEYETFQYYLERYRQVINYQRFASDITASGYATMAYDEY